MSRSKPESLFTLTQSFFGSEQEFVRVLDWRAVE
jgi:hypothetical protein